MNLPKLKIRPVSQQSCAAFGGINHHPTAPIGTWWDSRNLTSNKSPTLCARNTRTLHAAIDGNTPEVPIVAMCGGDHIVLLDETGTFWCNGNSQQVDFPMEVYDLGWMIRVDRSQMLGDTHVQVSPQYGSDRTWSALNHLGVTYDDDTDRWYIGQDVITFKCLSDEAPAPVWVNDLGNPGVLENPGGPEDYNITVTRDNLIEGLILEVRLIERPAALDEGHRLVRMGSLVIDAKAKVWINAVRLASGTTMIRNRDYGFLGVNNSVEYDDITLTMCDIDGNPYTGVVVSATEPTQEGYWLDVSGDKPKLMEWSVSSSMWITLASTYVQIECGDGSVFNGVKVFDTVKLYCGVPEDTDQNVTDILNSYQYIYGGIDMTVSPAVQKPIVAGILPAATVTVTNPGPDPDTGFTNGFGVRRDIPEMDYVVECGNRLWGCYYSEVAGLNEIYASKLGDPTNWDVFQGLSTDSWRASRGTAVPYTGAAVLDGHPLFFREESLEKVYPSASGAHQIQTFDLEGVELGAADSLCVIEDRLYYKSRGGVMVYTGSMPRRISDAFGDMVFRGGSGARHQMKYCLSTNLQGDTEEPVVLVLDLVTGDWHIEGDAWYGLAVTWKDDLYYIDAGDIKSMAEGIVYGTVNWYAETAPQAIHYDSASRSLTEHKWISYLRVRYRMLSNGTRQPDRLRIYIAYEDGDWQLLTDLRSGQTPLRTWEINLLPRRKDNFRLRFEGSGPVQIFDVAWRMERSEGGH